MSRTTRDTYRAELLTTGAMLVVATLGVKGVDFVKNLVSVSKFGLTDQGDIYGVALMIPELVVVAAGLDTIRGAATTYFTEQIAEGKRDEAGRLLSSLVTWLASIAAVVAAVVTLAMPALLHLVAPGFGDTKLHDAMLVAYAVVPVLLFRTVAGIFVAALNASGVFVRTALLPVIITVCVLAALVLAPPDRLALTVVSAYALGHAIYVVALAVLAGRHIPWGWTWKRVDRRFWEVAKFSGHLVVAMMVTQIPALVEKNVASYFPAGTVSSLAYANALASQAVMLVVLSLFGMMQRELTAILTEDKAEQAAAFLWKTISFMCFVLLGGIILMTAVPGPLLEVLYRRHAFDADAVMRTAPLLSVYGVWIAGQAIALPATTYALALKRPRIIVLASCVAYGSDAVLIGPLASWYGPIGIALAALWAVAVQSAILVFGLRRAHGEGFFTGAGALGRLALAAIAAVGVAIAIDRVGQASWGMSSSSLRLVAAAIGGWGIYVAVASALRVNYVPRIVSLLRRRRA